MGVGLLAWFAISRQQLDWPSQPSVTTQRSHVRQALLSPDCAGWMAIVMPGRNPNRDCSELDPKCLR